MVIYVVYLGYLVMMYHAIRKRPNQLLSLSKLNPLVIVIFIYVLLKALEKVLIRTEMKNSNFEILNLHYLLCGLCLLLGYIVFSGSDKR